MISAQDNIKTLLMSQSYAFTFPVDSFQESLLEDKVKYQFFGSQQKREFLKLLKGSLERGVKNTGIRALQKNGHNLDNVPMALIAIESYLRNRSTYTISDNSVDMSNNAIVSFKLVDKVIELGDDPIKNHEDIKNLSKLIKDFAKTIDLKTNDVKRRKTLVDSLNTIADAYLNYTNDCVKDASLSEILIDFRNKSSQLKAVFDTSVFEMTQLENTKLNTTDLGTKSTILMVIYQLRLQAFFNGVCQNLNPSEVVDNGENASKLEAWKEAESVPVKKIVKSGQYIDEQVKLRPLEDNALFKSYFDNHLIALGFDNEIERNKIRAQFLSVYRKNSKGKDPRVELSDYQAHMQRSNKISAIYAIFNRLAHVHDLGAYVTWRAGNNSELLYASVVLVNQLASEVQSEIDSGIVSSKYAEKNQPLVHNINQNIALVSKALGELFDSSPNSMYSQLQVRVGKIDQKDDLQVQEALDSLKSALAYGYTISSNDTFQQKAKTFSSDTDHVVRSSMNHQVKVLERTFELESQTFQMNKLIDPLVDSDLEKTPLEKLEMLVSLHKQMQQKLQEIEKTRLAQEESLKAYKISLMGDIFEMEALVNKSLEQASELKKTLTQEKDPSQREAILKQISALEVTLSSQLSSLDSIKQTTETFIEKMGTLGDDLKEKLVQTGSLLDRAKRTLNTLSKDVEVLQQLLKEKEEVLSKRDAQIENLTKQVEQLSQEKEKPKEQPIIQPPVILSQEMQQLKSSCSAHAFKLQREIDDGSSCSRKPIKMAVLNKIVELIDKLPNGNGNKSELYKEALIFVADQRKTQRTTIKQKVEAGLFRHDTKDLLTNNGIEVQNIAI
ncbi:hypothetical protein L3V82_04250 [Thiotrichales bacterium 19S3-7]|nr:hypothetical protein [Thiotrichales bacterium 19S3-7]MCF6802683.1 hypothetical protein [Thiotrichales bacterium 19S3-11]